MVPSQDPLHRERHRAHCRPLPVPTVLVDKLGMEPRIPIGRWVVGKGHYVKKETALARFIDAGAAVGRCGGWHPGWYEEKTSAELEA